MNEIITRKNSNLLIYVFLIILIIVISYFGNKLAYIYKNRTKEQYLTYFIPYYETKYTKFPNYRDFKYSDVKNLRIGHIDEDDEYADFIGKTLIGTTNLLNITKIKENYESDIIDGLINDKLDIGFVSVSNLKEYLKYRDYQKINYISYSYNNFLYMICRADVVFYSMNEIFSFKISIGRENGKTNTFCKYFFEKLYRDRYNELQLSSYEMDDGFNKLISGEIDILCYFAPFPSKHVKRWLDNTLLKLFYIHPVKLSSFEKQMVYQEDNIFREGYIDLNHISEKYLPIYITHHLYYTKFKPILETISSYNMIVCRKSLPNDVTYSIAALLYYNHELLIKKLGADMTPSQRLYQYSYIGTTQLHPGAYDFLTTVGFAKNSADKCYNNSKIIPCDKSIEVEREKNKILPFSYEINKPF